LIYAQYQHSIEEAEPNFNDMIATVNERFDRADEEYAQMTLTMDKIAKKLDKVLKDK